jgi:hypothetical protein
MIHCPSCGLLADPDENGACTRCGQPPYAVQSRQPVAEEREEPIAGEIVFHAMDRTKLVVMSLATFSIYPVFWFFRNWLLLRRLRGQQVWPFWRAVFSPLFAYSLFTQVRDDARSVGVEPRWEAGFLALTYFLCGLTGRMSDPYWLLALLVVVPLVEVQGTINAANAASGSPGPVNDRYSAANIVCIVVGCLTLGLAVVGILVGVE